MQHVIHYQLPRTSEIYVHRVGRCGRASQKGFTLALVTPDDVNNYQKICNILEFPRVRIIYFLFFIAGSPSSKS